ncbi:hypothetical protein PIB30_091684 [Stylosanthes scabra]|uniref:Uncharacterized protein n=1 Tax=Stylosanthes scabra TaxID=79078 RepID=A0ABU6SVU8_9FABA|nr:hypothetical protein [Stylosanthes scabra]
MVLIYPLNRLVECGFVGNTAVNPWVGIVCRRQAFARESESLMRTTLINESFVHPLHNSRFDLDCPYEILIESLEINQVLSSFGHRRYPAQGSYPSRRSSPTPHYSPKRPSSLRVSPPSPVRATTSLYRHMTCKSVKSPMRWELILSSEG